MDTSTDELTQYDDINSIDIINQSDLITAAGHINPVDRSDTIHPAPCGSGMLEMSSSNNQSFNFQEVKKRRFDECQNNNDAETLPVGSRVAGLACPSFLHLASSQCVYDATDHSSQSTLYHPIREDLMVNLRNIEQISFSFGSFFVANEKGEYKSTLQGYCIKLFRYSEVERSLYASRSFLITDLQVYQQLRRHIGAL